MEEKDEQYQLELPTIETLPWNDQYKTNGGVGGLNLGTQSKKISNDQELI